MESIIINPRNSVVNTDNNRIIYRMPTGHKFRDLEITLSNFFIFYSWFNVTSLFQNTTYSYTWHDATVNPVVMPEGFYTTSDINGFLELTMKLNNHYIVDANGEDVFFLNLVSNPVYYTVTQTSTVIPTALPAGHSNPGGMAFPVTASTVLLNIPTFTVAGTLGVGLLIGFSAGTTPAVSQTSTFQVNGDLIPQAHPVSNVILTCNLVDNSRFHIQDHVILTFAANTSVGSQIRIEPNVHTYYSVVERYYEFIEIELLDQNLRPLIVKDPDFQIELTVRTKRKFLEFKRSLASHEHTHQTD